MFDSISVEAIVHQTLQVMTWAAAQIPVWKAAADKMIWDQAPWWLRILIICAAVEPWYLLTRRVLRAMDLWPERRRTNKRFNLTRRR